MKQIILLAIAGIGLFSGGAARGVAIWDGEAGDGLWTNPVNWSANAQPVSGDNIFITNGNSVILPVGNLPNAITVTLSGASTLTASAGVVRLSGATINVSSGTLAGTWWDMGGGKMFFEDGAAATMSTIEHKGRNTFGFKLSPTGFNTLTPSQIRLASTAWSNMTYNIDASGYVVTNGYSVVLMDYASAGDTAYTNAFNPTVNIITNMGSPTASLSFNPATLQLILQYDAPPAPPKTWDGGGGDHSWTTPANWNPDGTPIANDKVLVGAGASVTNGQNAFASLMIDSGASVKFASFTAAGNVITNAGVISYPGTWRLTGAPVITLTGSGSFGSEIGWLDTQGARLNFWDGASVANGNMALELRNGTTFGFTLSNSGFTTLDFGQIWDGGTAWSNISFYLDLSSYNWSNGTTLVLADYNAQTAPLGGVFNPTVNITATNGLGGILSYNTVNSSLVLQLDPPGNDAPLVYNQRVSVYAGTPTNLTLAGTDLEGSNLTFTVHSQPTNGALTGTAPHLTYTATNATYLFDSFTFSAFDGENYSNTGTVKIAFIPYTDNELWSWYHPAILSDPVNTEWLTNWVESGISIWQIRYDLGPLTGSRTNAEPKIAAFYAYPVGGTNLPGLVQIHGGGQRAQVAEAKYWAQQGYAAICINWGALPLIDGVPNTDWDGLPGGFGPDFGRIGVTNALFQEWHTPQVYSDGATLYDVDHPLNSSWMLNSYAARRALTFLTEQGIVDDAKLGVVGWSMGGRTTVLASTDPRLTASSPGVGGTGFLYENWWGLPGTARPTNGIADVDLYIRTIDAQSYWPDITCPLLFLQAANDYNAPFDLVTKAMALQPTNVPQQLAIAPHFNHRTEEASYAARVLWMKSHLAGTFDFPKRAVSQIDFSNPDGIPRLRVWPDESTTNPLVRVDITYGLERDSRLRFWRDTQAVLTNGYWEAPCPIYDLDEMFVAHGVVIYDAGGPIPLPVGHSSTTRHFAIASEVITIYPPGLETNGVQETEVKVREIDDFTRGLKDWYAFNDDNTQLWEFFTRKVRDPSWRGPDGGALEVKVVTTAAANWISVTVFTEQWNGTDATVYKAFGSLPLAGTNTVTLPLASFTNGLGAALTTWSNANQIRLTPGYRFDGSLPAWSGAIARFAGLAWVDGYYRPGEECANWMASFGIRGTNAAPTHDVLGEGNANLMKYALGISPLAGDESGLFPTIGLQSGGPVQGLDYVYRRRRDAAERGLTYTVQAASNLVANMWTTNGTQEMGYGIVDANYEFVTNRISGGAFSAGRLKVELNE
jgi:dienelactone hydrolase